MQTQLLCASLCWMQLTLQQLNPELLKVKLLLTWTWEHKTAPYQEFFSLLVLSFCISVKADVSQQWQCCVMWLSHRFPHKCRQFTHRIHLWSFISSVTELCNAGMIVVADSCATAQCVWAQPSSLKPCVSCLISLTNVWLVYKNAHVRVLSDQ